MKFLRTLFGKICCEGDEMGIPVVKTVQTPETATNIPAWARNSRLLRTDRVPTKHWSEGPIGFILLGLGVALPFVLSFIFSGSVR